jgi:hypothetical protein
MNTYNTDDSFTSDEAHVWNKQWRVFVTNVVYFWFVVSYLEVSMSDIISQLLYV